MDIKNKDNLMLTFSPAHFSTRSGFTLVETLVTLAILAMLGSVAGGVYYSVQEQKDFEATMVIMVDVKKAILGTYSPRARGVSISGYVVDMGSLPSLNKDGQPEDLWEQGDFPHWQYNKDKRIWAGWNGPYIRRPAGNFIIDGYGRGLIFKENMGNISIISCGADGKEGGSGMDEDIKMVIKKEDYMAPVGGHLEEKSLTINYPHKGRLTSKTIHAAGNGNFISKGDSELIPVGLRSADPPDSGQPIVFSVQPAMNWLGTLR